MMANEERCVCCGEIIPEGRSVCSNCMTASGSESKKHKPTELQDLWYNALCGIFVGMSVIGFWFIGALVVFLVAGDIIDSWWCFACLALASAMLTFGILRYLGRGGR